ncbi:MAG: ATP-binding cassette domain-containing protein [Spirochaetaceae bacterium]|nr:ATP-binding cassette domain-containing protein [Spirochaetaceae bacterium]
MSYVPQPQSPGNYEVSFTEVSFSCHREKDIEALSGVSFTARQGEITAIVGLSGSGKSTIAHLLRCIHLCPDGGESGSIHEFGDLHISCFLPWRIKTASSSAILESSFSRFTGQADMVKTPVCRMGERRRRSSCRIS